YRMLAYLLIYSILCYFITICVTKEYIFSFFRDYLFIKGFNRMHALFTCVTCFSFWVGVLVSSILIIYKCDTVVSLVYELPVCMDIFLSGCFTSGIVTLIEKIK